MSDFRLSFIHISDTHLNADPAYRPGDFAFPLHASAAELVRRLQDLPFQPDFVLHTGDVTYGPDPDAYTAARELLSHIPYPVYYAAGNHDNPAALQRLLLGRDDILTPFDYTVEINGAQLIVVDSNGPAPHPAGFVTPPQLDWLERLCAASDDRPLIVAVHHNALPVGVPWLDKYMGMTNGEDFHAALLPARRRLRGVFFGHVHQNLTIQRDGVLYASALSTWEQLHAWPEQTRTIVDAAAEPGFNVVTITRDQTFIRRHRFPAPLTV